MRKAKLTLLSLIALGAMSLASCTGAQGEKGDKGDQGEQGIQGEPGEPGEPGKDGSFWYSGEGAPSSDLGKEGDMYLDTTNSDVYQKGADGWTKITNIKGDDGEDGEDGEDGTNGSNGSNGKTAWSNTILPSEFGYVTPSVGSATVGSEITFYVHADPSYYIDEFKVRNNGIEVALPQAVVTDGVPAYTLKMQENGFVVMATFKDSTTSTSYFKDGKLYTGGEVDGMGNIINEGTIEGTVEFGGGSGTDTDPLLINTEEQFQFLDEIPNYLVNGVNYDEQLDYHFKLMDDITITSQVDYFSGEFDGNGKTITYKGNNNYLNNLFGNVYGDVEIKSFDLIYEEGAGSLLYSVWNQNKGDSTEDYYIDNILIKDINIKTNKDANVNSGNFGFITCNSPFNSNRDGVWNIENVHIEANVYNAGTCASAFIGSGPCPIDGNIKIKFDNCSFNGEITSKDRVGLLYGNAAYNERYDDVENIKSCITASNIEFNGTLSSTGTAGIVPYISETDTDLGYQLHKYLESTLTLEGTFVSGNTLSEVTGKIYYDSTDSTLKLNVVDYTPVTANKLGIILSVAKIKLDETGELQSNSRNVIVNELETVSDTTSLTQITEVKAYSENEYLKLYPDATLDFDYKLENYNVALAINGSSLAVVFEKEQGYYSIDPEVTPYLAEFDENGRIVGKVRATLN